MVSMTRARSQRAPSSLDKSPNTHRPYLTNAFASVPLAFYLALRFSSGAIRLYETLCLRAFDGVAVLRRPVLLEKLGCCARSLRRDLEKLEEAGVIKQEKDGDLELIKLVPLHGLELGQLRYFDPKDFDLVAPQPETGREARVLVNTSITTDTRLTPTERRVLAFYLAVADARTGRSWWDRFTVAGLLGIAPDTLSRCRARLDRFGYLQMWTMNDGRQMTRVLRPTPPAKKGGGQNDQSERTERSVEADRTISLSINQNSEPESEPEKQTCACAREELPAKLSLPISVPRQDIAQVMAAVEEAVGDVEDSNADLVEQLVTERLKRGQKVRWLVACLTAYASRAHYRIPASNLLRSGLDKWAPGTNKNPNRCPQRLYVSARELAFEQECRVGAHNPKPVLTSRQKAKEDELRRQWLALPLELPPCRLDTEAQDRLVALRSRQCRGQKEVLAGWIVSEVWSGNLDLEHVISGCEDPHAARVGLEPYLCGGRQDMTFEQFKALLTPRHHR